MANYVGRKAVTLEPELAHRPNLRPDSLSSQPGLCDNAATPIVLLTQHLPWIYVASLHITYH